MKSNVLSLSVINTSSEHSKKKYKRVFHYSNIYRCPRIINWRMFELANRLAGSFEPATEYEINMFWPLPYGELV